MNFQNGMRRLAIFVGVLGAFAGGFYSYKDLRDVPSERYQHKVFESIAASDLVVRERKALLSSPATADKRQGVDYDALAKKYGGVLEPASGPEVRSAPASTDVNEGNIRRIYWNPDLSVDFFEMEDGGFVASGPSPSAWKYLLWLVFPAIGFVIAWGVVRAIMWVSAGFFEAT